MLLRITVLDLARGRRPCEVLVDAVPGSTAAELGDALGRLLDVNHEAATVDSDAPDLFVGGRRLQSHDEVGWPPLLDGAVVTLGGSGVGPLRRAPGVLELHLVSGPDAGQIFRLPPGEHRLGRSAEADLRVDDRDVSRVHALVTVESTSVTVTDLSSSNGTVLDGRPLVGTAPMGTSQVLQVGRSTLRLRLPDGIPAAVRADGAGHLLVNRRPRLPTLHRPATVTFPDPPSAAARSRLPMLALLVPLVLSGVIAAVMRSPTMLLFGLMGPLLMLTTWAGERRGGARGRRRQHVEHRDAMGAARGHLERALQDEGLERERRHPDLATLLSVVEGIGSRLWERRPDHEDSLLVRIGTGRAAPSIRVLGDPALDEPLQLDGVPIPLDLRALGVVGVAGPRLRTLGLARAMLAQLAAWHSPLDLRMVLLLSPETGDDDWTWATLLPHLDRGDGAAASWVARLDDGHVSDASDAAARCVGAVARLVEDRHATRSSSGGRVGHRPDVVVILDGSARLRAVPGLSGVLEHGPDVGVFVLAIDRTRERLPVEARGVISVRGSSRAIVCLPGEAASVELAIDEPQGRWAVRLARAMAPLRDATPEAAVLQVPAAASLLDLLGPGVVDERRLAAQWSARPRSTALLLGVGAEGPLLLDLRRDGPHALVAGTTGAGKSELLQSLIAGLALGNRPDELVFVLVDYKGGSAFRECARLPHTVGLVTDLDGHLAERALTSLGAELRRRERLLGQAGVADLEQYQTGSARAPIPRLVLLIDEFRLLAEELPDFVSGLVKIAAVGRSLGVHLVLATQRPAGIVSADIRANVGLRIALRVRDRLDSTDVIESPDAAAIPSSTPGRAFVRSAETPLTQFQTARVAVAASNRPRVVVTAFSPWCQARPQEPATSAAPGGVTDLSRVVTATQGAARLHGIPRVPGPWLPPLPEVVPLDSLAAGAAIPLGLRDDPLGQCQRTFCWDVRDGGHLGLAGGPRSGRTTALRTVAGALATRFGPDAAHLYAVHSGGLSELARLPHTGAVANHYAVEHVDDILRCLLDQVRRRREVGPRLGQRSAAGHDEEDAETTGQVSLPWLVLLVDGWESLVEALGAVDYGRPTQDLLRLLRDGAAVGLRVVVTGERALLTGQLCGLLATRLVLPMSDPMQLALAGIPAKSVPTSRPPGRAIDVGDHHEIQLAVLGRDGSDAGQSAALTEIGRAAVQRGADQDPRLLPTPVKPLPPLVTLAGLLAHPRSPRDRDHVVVGVRAGDHAPAGFDLAGGQRRILVVGPRRSGRSTALAVLALGLAAAGREVAVLGTSALADPASGGTVHHLATDHVEGLVALRRRHRDLAVVADNVERLTGTALEPVLREISRLVDEDGGVVVAATSPAALAAGGTGPHTELARARTGLLLCPSTSDGDLLGVRTTRPAERLPGRGVLVAGGDSLAVQVALLDVRGAQDGCG